MKIFLMRTYQWIMKFAMNFLPWREPIRYKGVGMLRMTSVELKSHSIQHVLIVTDDGVKNSGIVERVTTLLDESNISFEIFADVKPNPDEAVIEEISKVYINSGAKGFIGIGGGSVIDATKVASVIVNQTDKKPRDFEGMLKIRKKSAYTLMIPTTAGTGSEVTLAAVISNPDERKKYRIMDPKLIPNATILSPEVVESLPAKLTAETGMDALTHAVEAYINRSQTKQTEKDALQAVNLIHQNLEKSYDEPHDLGARLSMLEASYFAGRAFTRAYVGNIHAISHALTAFYDAPHGQTNATVMPIVLRMYGDVVYQRLAELADQIELIDISSSDEEKALAFIEWIEGLNGKFKISKTVPEIDMADMEELITHAYKEANPLYPVPVIFDYRLFKAAILKVRGETIE